jgi:ribosome-associated translation inhibitor RaiA
MPVPLQISFRNMEPNAEIETLVRDRVAALEKFFDRIVRCRVVLDIPHRQRYRGKLCDVRIDLHVPGEEIVISRPPGPDSLRHGLAVAIHEAFDEARRRVREFARRRRDFEPCGRETP